MRRHRPGGRAPSLSGLNRFIHIAGAPHLLPDTHTLYEGATEVGRTYPVRVRPDTPLYGEVPLRVSRRSADAAAR